MPDNVNDLNPTGPQELIDLGNLSAPTYMPMPNPKDPKLGNIMVPQLKLFEMQPVKGWDADDYREFYTKLKPVEDDLLNQMSELEKRTAKSVNDYALSLGAKKNPDGKYIFQDEQQVQQFNNFYKQQTDLMTSEFQGLNEKSKELFNKTAKDFGTPKHLKSVQKMHSILTNPMQAEVVESEVFNPENITTQDQDFAAIQDRLDRLNIQFENEVDPIKKNSIMSQIEVLEKRKNLFTKPAAAMDNIDFSGVTKIKIGDLPTTKGFTGDKIPARLVDQKYAPTQAYNYESLKDGDLIFADPQSSVINLYRKKGSELEFTRVPVQVRTEANNEYKDENVYGYKVAIKDGKYSFIPQWKPTNTVDAEWVSTDPKTTEQDKIETNQYGVKTLPGITVENNKVKSYDPEKVKQFMSKLDKTDNSMWGVFTSLTEKTGIPNLTRPETKDGEAIANFLYSRPEYAKEFANYIKTQEINPTSPLDWERLIKSFNQTKIDDINNKQSQLNVSDTKLATYTEAIGRITVNQQLFKRYSDKVVSEIKAIEEQLKQNPKSSALRERLNRLKATYNKSYEAYSVKHQQLDDYVNQMSDPELMKYLKLEEGKSFIGQTNYKLERQLTVSAPTLAGLDAGENDLLKTRTPSGTDYIIPLQMAKGFLSGAASLGLGIASWFDDSKTLGYIDYLQKRKDNWRESMKYTDENPDGSINWGGKILNTTFMSGEMIPDTLMMFLAPEIKAAGWAKNLSGAIRRFPGLFATIGLPHMQQSVQEAKDAGIKSVSGQYAYATTMAAIQAVTESFFPLPKFAKGITKGTISQFRKEIKGELIESIPGLLRSETRESRKQALRNQFKTAVKLFVSRANLEEVADMYKQEILVEEMVAAVLNQTVNVGTNAVLQTKLNEDLLSFENITNTLLSGLWSMPFFTAGRVWKGADMVHNRESNLYNAVENLGFTTVYNGVARVKKMIDEGTAPADIDVEFVNRIYSEMPYVNLLERPADISKSKWTLMTPFLAQYKKAEEQMKTAEGPLKEVYRGNMKAASEKIAVITGMSEENVSETIDGLNKKSEEAITDYVKSNQPAVEEVKPEEVKPEEVKVEAPVQQSPVVANVQPDIERIKALPEDGSDGATFAEDGSKYEGGGLIVPALSMNTTQEELTPQMVEQFMEENRDLLNTGAFKVGLYKFPNSNKVSIDLNIVAKPENREVALKFGRMAGQKSIFDLSTFEDVDTGADGSNPASFTKAELKEIGVALNENRLPEVGLKDPAEIEQQLQPIQQELEAIPATENVREQMMAELEAAAKPVFSMDFTPENQMGNKTVMVTFEDEESGEQVLRPVPAQKLAASVKARFNVLEKLSNCIG